jgi:hypothetical protein
MKRIVLSASILATWLAAAAECRAQNPGNTFIGGQGLGGVRQLPRNTGYLGGSGFNPNLFNPAMNNPLLNPAVNPAVNPALNPAMNPAINNPFFGAGPYNVNNPFNAYNAFSPYANPFANPYLNPALANPYLAAPAFANPFVNPYAPYASPFMNPFNTVGPWMANPLLNPNAPAWPGTNSQTPVSPWQIPLTPYQIPALWGLPGAMTPTPSGGGAPIVGIGGSGFASPPQK